MPTNITRATTTTVATVDLSDTAGHVELRVDAQSTELAVDEALALATALRDYATAAAAASEARA